MKTSALNRRTLSICAVAFALAACGGSQSPIGAPGAMPQSRTTAARAGRGGSWMLPEAKSIKRLLYVGDSDDIMVFDYDTRRQVGDLTGFHYSYGLCVDKDGDVFLTTEIGSAGAVMEYAHGGASPIQTFDTAGHPIGCSIAPKTGDLAVGNGLPSAQVDVQIWKHAGGLPVSYPNDARCQALYPPGYDNKGNLYFETGDPRNVCEIPVDGSAIIKVPFPHGIGFPGAVMWDGKHLTFADQLYNNGQETAIYRVRALKDGTLSVVGTTLLEDKPHYYGTTYVMQPFIVGTRNTPVNHEEGTVAVGGNTALITPRCQYWHYPSSGKTYTHTREAVLYSSGGTVVSIRN